MFESDHCYESHLPAAAWQDRWFLQPGLW